MVELPVPNASLPIPQLNFFLQVLCNDSFFWIMDWLDVWRASNILSLFIRERIIFYYNLQSHFKVPHSSTLFLKFYIYIYILSHFLSWPFLFSLSLPPRLQFKALSKVPICASMAAKSVSQNRIRAKLHFFYAILLLQFATFGLAATAKLHPEEGTEEFPK